MRCVTNYTTKGGRISGWASQETQQPTKVYRNKRKTRIRCGKADYGRSHLVVQAGEIHKKNDGAWRLSDTPLTAQERQPCVVEKHTWSLRSRKFCSGSVTTWIPRAFCMSSSQKAASRWRSSAPPSLMFWSAFVVRVSATA